MDAGKLDWAILDRLREGFLSGRAAAGPYWRSLQDLEQYNLTYGERIGWKWDAVLREIQARGWSPLSSSPTPPGASKAVVLDWGCGSGVAGRRVIQALGHEKVGTLWLHDHSALARQFSTQAAKAEFPQLTVGDWRGEGRVDVLVISHVLNELSPAARAELLAAVRSAATVIWVEPGTHAVSRDLIGIREQLRAEFHVVAPCTHSERCGLLAAENAAHWCHSFASPPPAIYADSDWVRFGQRAGIDLRSLPYSFLVLERASAGSPPTERPPLSRMIGDPRHFKGYAKWLNCDAAGVRELTLQKRDDPDLFKSLKRDTGIPVYRWEGEDDKVRTGANAFPL